MSEKDSGTGEGVMAMRLIRQPDENTCGVATVAMVAGVPFSAARKSIGWDEGEHDFTSLGMMLDALRGYSIVCGSRLRRGRNGLAAITGNAVISFDPVKGAAFEDTHWAVWDAKRGRLLDPDPDTDRSGAPFRYLEFARPEKI